MSIDITNLKGYLDVEWRTKEQILGMLKWMNCPSNDREFRQFVADYDEEYCKGLHDSYICNGQNGYLLTSDPEEIKKSILIDTKRIIALSKRVYGVKKRLAQDNQISLLEDEEEIKGYEIIMKQQARYGMQEGDENK